MFVAMLFCNYFLLLFCEMYEKELWHTACSIQHTLYIQHVQCIQIIIFILFVRLFLIYLILLLFGNIFDMPRKHFEQRQILIPFHAIQSNPIWIHFIRCVPVPFRIRNTYEKWANKWKTRSGSVHRPMCTVHIQNSQSRMHFAFIIISEMNKWTILSRIQIIHNQTGVYDIYVNTTYNVHILNLCNFSIHISHCHNVEFIFNERNANNPQFNSMPTINVNQMQQKHRTNNNRKIIMNRFEW